MTLLSLHFIFAHRTKPPYLYTRDVEGKIKFKGIWRPIWLAALDFPWHIKRKNERLHPRYWNRSTRDLLRTISLFLVLMAVWLLLSGYYTPLIISFGIASCLLSALIARRMEVVDNEGHPLHLGPRIVFYWAWLLKEIFKANIDVAKCVLFPKTYLRPNMFTAKVTQTSDLGKVIYANSITLTPGTVTVDLDNDTVMVHAMTENSAEGVKSGEMDRRVTAVMGEA